MTTRPMQKRTGLVLYYGMDYPCLKAAERYSGMVVLQSYHPAVASGHYAAIFPRAERYLYYNPVKTYGESSTLVFGPEGNPPFPGAMPKGEDAASSLTVEQWLGAQDKLRHKKLTEAAQLMGLQGVSGLFVDDTDHWLGADQEHRYEKGLNLLQQVAHLASERLILNRGFRFWPMLAKAGALRAVVLENMGLSDINHWAELGRVQELSWLKAQLSSNLPALHRTKAEARSAPKSAVPVFALSYKPEPREAKGMATAQVAGDSAVKTDYEALTALLERYVTEYIYSNAQLDCWPEPFQAEG